MLNSGDERFVFGPFELRSASGELLGAGLNLKLPPQPLRVLSMLVSRPGELVSRKEIREALWNDGTTVEFDQSLNFCIRQIRAALADDAREPKYIETLPKRGYRFIAPSRAASGITTAQRRASEIRGRNKWRGDLQAGARSLG